MHEFYLQGSISTLEYCYCYLGRRVEYFEYSPDGLAPVCQIASPLLGECKHQQQDDEE